MGSGILGFNLKLVQFRSYFGPWRNESAAPDPKIRALHCRNRRPSAPEKSPNQKSDQETYPTTAKAGRKAHGSLELNESQGCCVNKSQIRSIQRNRKEEQDISPKISIRKERGVIRASMVLDGPCRGGEVRYLGVNGMKAGPTRPRSTSFAAPPAPPAGAPRTPPRPPSFRPLEGAPLPGPPHRLRRRRCAVIAPRPRRSDPRGTTD